MLNKKGCKKWSQFHYGSIKTIMMTNCETERLSQFHYGSIKTNKTSFEGMGNGVGLNSTMVRLKHMIQIYSIAKAICLNSTMVRLKQIYVKLKLKDVKWSQFHYGSIKTVGGC